MRIVKTVAGASVALWAAAAGAHLAEPVHVRNLNPLVSIFGLPAWDTVPIGTRFGATVEIANHYRFSLKGNERLMLDGETVRTGLSFTHGFASGWSLGVEVPYYRISGGFLDDAIDSWHSAFGMPDGGRNARPENEFLFAFVFITHGIEGEKIDDEGAQSLIDRFSAEQDIRLPEPIAVARQLA